MKKWYSLIILIGLFFYPLGGFAEKNCLQCHSQVEKQLKVSYVHPPLKKGECTACHSSHTSDFSHLLKKPIKKTCLSCHKEETVAYLHLPLAKGECTKCHNPHASTYKWLLRKPSQQLCFDCHKKNSILIGKYVHKPVAQDCLSCHRAHGSNYQCLLTIPLKTVCFRCHNQKKILATHHVKDMETADCLSCHNVHAASNTNLLHREKHSPYAKKQCSVCHVMKGNEIVKVKVADRDLCLKCHPQVEKEKAIYTHLQIGLNPNGCLDCHSPHSADIKPMLKNKPYRICFSCHQDARKRIFSSAPQYKYKHPKVKEKECLVCHKAHTSNNLFFLKKGKIDTCLACHGKHIKFSHPMGKKAIDPRNHQPITCVTCHHPMGAKDKYNVIFDHNKELCIQCHQIGT